MKMRYLLFLMAMSLFTPLIQGKSLWSSNSLTAVASEGDINEEEGAEVDPVAAMITSSPDVEVTVKNDETYPWVVGDGYLTNGNVGIKRTSSCLTITVKSECRSELSFEWMRDYYSWHTVMLYIDGEYKNDAQSWNYAYCRYFMDAGEHTIVFRDSIFSDNSNNNDYSRLRNININAFSPLEPVAISEKSLPITITNEGENPWVTSGGYIQNSNYCQAKSASTFTATFTIDKPSKFSFDRWVNRYDGNTSNASTYHNLVMNLKGDNGYYWNLIQYYTADWEETLFYLEPGAYSLTFVDTIFNTTTPYYSRIRNMELSSDWVDVELSSAGSLGVEILYQVNVLNDVELLKIKGPLNETDWTTIKNCKNLVAIDLTEASFEALPDNAFNGMSRVSSVKMPEGMLTIGEQAFLGTHLQSVDIPSSVTSIGYNAFYGTPITACSFKEDSKLNWIGAGAFEGCKYLHEFMMPDGVTTLGTSTYYSQYGYVPVSHLFYGCTSLKKVHFSKSLKILKGAECEGCTRLYDVELPDSLNEIRRNSFYNTPKLRKLKFPENLCTIQTNAFYGCGLDSICLPVKLSTLEKYAFRNCDSLKYVELPSYIESYESNFSSSDNIEKIVCRSATPPVITSDPFASERLKSQITLVVPSFAVVNYKLDTYWMQFGSIEPLDITVDYWKISGNLSLTNNRRMDGKPDVDLFDGGKLTIGGNAPFEARLFNFFPYQPNPCSLLTDCPNIKADSVNTYYGVEANKWYFFTPLYDVDLSKVEVTNNVSYVFRYYDSESRALNGTGSSWKNVTNGVLKAGQGYIFQCNGASAVTFPADSTVHEQVFTVNDVTLPLTAYDATNSANKSWNYVGNPYPSFYDVYYMDFTAPITVWTGSTYKAYSIVDDNYVLRPMEAFFVQKPDEVEQIVFHKEGRQHTTSVSRPSGAPSLQREATTASRFFFDLQLAGEQLSDETRVVINEQASTEYELTLDASKFMSFEPKVPQLYTLDLQGTGYAINERPLAEGTVALAYYAGEAGFYTLSATRAEGTVYLHDHLLGKTVDLTTQDYIFHSEATDEADNTRFSITIKVDNTATDIATATTGKIAVSGRDGQILVDAADGTAVIVYATDGKTVYSGTSHSIPVAQGSYLVKVGRTTYKVHVN